MRLRPGTDVQRALVCLSEAMEALRSSTQGVGGDFNHAHDYVRAVSTVERTLRAAFAEVPLDRLHTRRYWAISAMESPRVIELVSDERDHQLEWMGKFEQAMRGLLKRFAGEGDVAVVDTNVLLHHRLFIEVDWPLIVRARAVRLVVPLRVIDELDMKKAARRSDLRDRARIVLRHLEENIGSQFRDGVTLEVLSLKDLDPDALPRRDVDADTEILDVCEAVTGYAGANRTHLLTGDLSMTIRAREREISVRRMPDEPELAIVDEAPES